MFYELRGKEAALLEVPQSDLDALERTNWTSTRFDEWQEDQKRHAVFLHAVAVAEKEKHQRDEADQAAFEVWAFTYQQNQEKWRAKRVRMAQEEAERKRAFHARQQSALTRGL